MKMFAILLLVPMLAVSAFASGSGDDNAMEKESMEKDSMESDAMMSEDSMMAEDSMDKMGLIDPFPNFMDLESAAMKADSAPTVLFFYATWCPTCKVAADELKANPEKLDGVNLLIVDYDNSDDLQRKYGVTYQHTFVLIDSEGEAVDTWNGGGIDDILMHAEMKEM